MINCLVKRNKNKDRIKTQFLRLDTSVIGLKSSPVNARTPPNDEKRRDCGRSLLDAIIRTEKTRLWNFNNNHPVLQHQWTASVEEALYLHVTGHGGHCLFWQERDR